MEVFPTSTSSTGNVMESESPAQLEVSSTIDSSTESTTESNSSTGIPPSYTSSVEAPGFAAQSEIPTTLDSSIDILPTEASLPAQSNELISPPTFSTEESTTEQGFPTQPEVSPTMASMTETIISKSGIPTVSENETSTGPSSDGATKDPSLSATLDGIFTLTFSAESSAMEPSSPDISTPSFDIQLQPLNCQMRLTP